MRRVSSNELNLTLIFSQNWRIIVTLLIPCINFISLGLCIWNDTIFGYFYFILPWSNQLNKNKIYEIICGVFISLRKNSRRTGTRNIMFDQIKQNAYVDKLISFQVEKLLAECEYPRTRSFWNAIETTRTTKNSHFCWNENGITSSTIAAFRDMLQNVKRVWSSSDSSRARNKSCSWRSTIMIQAKVLWT